MTLLCIMKELPELVKSVFWIGDVVVGLGEFKDFVNDITTLYFEEVFSMFVFFAFFLALLCFFFGIVWTHGLIMLEVFFEFLDLFFH
jgi:hypothetical protein